MHPPLLAPGALHRYLAAMEEADYLFRHAALRDAAYHLQLPSERARLHKHTLEILEALLPAPERNQYATALADHAQLAQVGVTWLGDALPRKELDYLLSAAQAAVARYENEQAAALYDRIAGHAAASAGQRIDAMIEAGVILWFTGRRQAAISRLDEAVVRAAGDTRRLAFALIERGTLYRDLNQTDRAEHDLSAALNAARQCPDENLELRALGNLCTVRQTGKVGADVEALYAPVLRLAQRLNNARAIGISKGQIAQGWLDLGDYRKAESLLLESLDLLRQTGDLMNQAVMLSTLGSAFLRRHDGDVRGARQRAVSFYREAIRVNHEIGNRPQQAEAKAGLARACLELGLELEAERTARSAIQDGRELGKQAALASGLEILGLIEAGRGNDAAAESHWREALAVAAPGSPLAREVRGRLAALLRRQGRTRDAELVEATA